ncbi:MAG: hypothetical protein P1V20_10225 [Verrucomicrobiales bacterium]|nr:hypothetical protein [Verrucomicrobiales bacterium]
MRDGEFQDKSNVYRHGGANSPRKPELNIWQRMSRVMEMIIYVLLLLAFAKLISPELEKQKELGSELEKLQAIKREKEAQTARMRREHSNIISDRRYMEAVARDRLNLQREGEFVIHIDRNDRP